MTENHPLKDAIDAVGLGPLAKALGLTYPAIRKWERAGRLPRTEWTGETTYAEQIETLTGGSVTKESLLKKWPELAQPSAAESCAAIEPAAAQGVE